MKQLHFLFSSLLLLAACEHKMIDAAEQDKEMVRTPKIEDSIVEPTERLVLTGEITADPKRLCRVVAPIDGRIEDFYVGIGDNVSKGQIVARLVGRATAEMKIQQRAAESELAIATREKEIKEALFDDGLVSEREVAEAIERYEVAKTTCEQLQKVSNGDIAIPQGGTILRRMTANGQYIQVGEPILEVANLQRVWAVGNVYESDISKVERGREVVVTTLAYPEERHYGRIDHIQFALDSESKTVKVSVVLDNAERHLLPGMFATITLMP